MKILLFASIFCLSLMGFNNRDVFSKEVPTSLVNLKNATNDLHAPFMALKIANALLDKQHNVVLFLNLEGANLADKSRPLNLKYGISDQTIGQLLDKLSKRKAKIFLCPHCAKIAGIDKKNIRSGIKLATHDEVASIFANADKVIDY